jgi:vacuolar-type H+-ATPase subunit I/STV1
VKIGELLELTQSKKLAEIAKEHLEIGEKKAIAGLKEAGCFNISGKRGWFYDKEDKSVLDQSIYDFAPITTRGGKPKAKANVLTEPTKRTKAPKNKTAKEVNDTKNQRSNVSEESSKEEIAKANEQVAPTLEQTSEPTLVVRKRSSFDLDVELMKELKIQAVINDKNVYEMVETAIRKYLQGLK